MADDSGPDTVDIASNIGTWIAAGVAIVALVGVVGPYLALQASLSDSNRAMNAVQDRPQKYITRGFRLTRGLRVFRRVRVPDLAPSYISNEPEKTLLIGAAVAGRWTVNSRDYLPWNTGWAKLSELIEAYSIRDATSNDAVDLAVPKDGTLEVVNSRTALVVSKHWVLLLGLLGRYGKRSDKGVLQRGGTRRDDHGERANIKSIMPIHENLKYHDDKRMVGMPGPEVEESEDDGIDELSQDGSEYGGYGRGPPETMLVRRNAYGELTIESKPKPKVYGVTGTMAALGRHKGSWSYLTAISFVPHTAREMFPKGVESKGDSVSPETLFWLAHGFLPCEIAADGRLVVLSLEDPDSPDDFPYGPADRDTDRGIGMDEEEAVDLVKVYSLQETDDLPLSIGESARCLGMTEPQVLRLLPYEGDAREAQIHSLALRRTRSDNTQTQVRGHWVLHQEPRGGVTRAFLRRDLERIVGGAMSLEWDTWGFLLREPEFVSYLLWRASRMLRRGFLRRKQFRDALGVGGQALRTLGWKMNGGFNQRRMEDRIALDGALANALASADVLPLRLALAALFVLDDDFRDKVQVAAAQMAGVRLRVRRREDREEEEEAAVARFRALRARMDDLARQHYERRGREEGLARAEEELRAAKREAERRHAMATMGGGASEHGGRRGDEGRESEDDMFLAALGGGGGPRTKPPIQHMMLRLDDESLILNDPPPEVSEDKDEDIAAGEAESGSIPEVYSLPDLEPATEPTETIIATDDVMEDTLVMLNVSFQREKESPYLTIDRSVPAWELDLFRNHTKTLRLIEAIGEDPREDSSRGTVGRLEYDYGSRTLRWYNAEGGDRDEGAEFTEWVMEGDLVRVAGAEKVVKISTREVVLVGLWAANRCAMWTGSLDSGALLGFMADLDPHVYVL